MGKRLARLELSQLSLNFLDISPIPFSDPSLRTGAPHLGITDGHATAVPGDSGWSRNERRPAARRGGENKFCWDVFAKRAVDLVHLLTFCVRFLLVQGIGGGGYWAHREVINDRRERSGERAELGLYDAMVIWRDHDRTEVKDKGRRTVGIPGAARHRHRVGGGEIYRG